MTHAAALWSHPSEEGHSGHLFVRVDGNGVDGEPRLLRRSKRTRASQMQCNGRGGGENITQTGRTLSGYFASQLKVSSPHPQPADKVRTDPASHQPNKRAKRRRATMETTIKEASDVQDGIDLDNSYEPPQISLFPSLALKLHGLASDRTGSFYGLVQELITPDVFGMVVVTILLNQTTGRAAIPVFYALMHRWPTPSSLAEAEEDELRELLRPIGLFNIRAKRLKEMGREWCNRPPRWGVRYQSRVILPATWALVDPEKDVAQELQRDGNASGCGKGRPVQVLSSPPRKFKRERTRPLYPPTEISHLPGVGRYALDSYLLFRPSRTHPTMASVQIDLCSDGGVEGKLKPTSDAWQKVLERRLELGERKDVGELLPPETADEDAVNGQKVAHAGIVSTLPMSVEVEQHWRTVEALDKELKAYMQWRLGREEGIHASRL